MDTTPTAATSRKISANTRTLSDFAELAGRILLAVLFLLSGLGKLGAYSATAGYMAAKGVPGALLPLVIFTEVAGGAAVLVGWQARLVAFLLAGYTLVAALFFHSDFGDQNQAIHFMKNVAIAGGFLLLVAHGAGRWSLDRHFRR